MKKFISNSRRIFLVKFRQSTELFIVQDRELFDLLITNEHMHIEFIKHSEDYQIKFKRCAKSVILKQFSWDTEIIEYLTKRVYFKGVKYL